MSREEAAANPDNLEIVNGWLVERDAHPADYPAGAAYGALPYSDAEPLLHLSELPGWPKPLHLDDAIVERAAEALYVHNNPVGNWSAHSARVKTPYRGAARAVLAAAVEAGQ